MIDKLDMIRERAIDLVADAINDEDIPAAKRADMALNLLGKQAIKDQPQQTNFAPVELWFVEQDDEGNEIRRFGYEFIPATGETEVLKHE